MASDIEKLCGSKRLYHVDTSGEIAAPTLVACPTLPYHRAMSESKPSGGTPPIEERISFGNEAVHRAFQDQVAALLDQADLTDDERQQILIAMNCPCCGAGGLSLSVKIKDATDGKPSF